MNRQRKKLETKILAFIEDYIKRNQRPPTVREIARALGFNSTSSVVYHLDRLEKAGFLKREKGSSRNLRLINISPESSETVLPVVGTVRAGQPVYAEENIEAYVNLPAYFARKADFILRVKGDSMTGAGIFEGDLLLVKQTPVVQPGEIGVFLVDGEATVKELRLVNGRAALVPKNPAYEVIFPEEITVIGKVVAVFRDLENSP